jgi:hypothetical protein
MQFIGIYDPEMTLLNSCRMRSLMLITIARGSRHAAAQRLAHGPL